MEGVRVVVVVGLIDAVLEPTAATVHGLELVEVGADHRAIRAMSVAVPAQKLEDVHGHEQVVVVHDPAAAGGGQPGGDQIALRC